MSSELLPNCASPIPAGFISGPNLCDEVVTNAAEEEEAEVIHSVENKHGFSSPAKMQSSFKDTTTPTILESTLKKGRTLSKMPVSAGHSVCWSNAYAAIDEALSIGDKRLLRLLWEVSNQVTVRFRFSPDICSQRRRRNRYCRQISEAAVRKVFSK